MKYFDYAATTPPSDEALEAYVDVSKNIYGNPGSSKIAKELEEKTREQILKSIGLYKTCNLVFTSGGTEANNLAIKGVIKNNIQKGSHFITSHFEHASVYEVFKKLEYGNKVSYVGIDSKGYIDVKAFKKLLRPNTKLVSLMHVNNELGTEQPIKELYEITKEYNKDIIFITDSVQGLGKVKALDFIPDLLTISSHKIYGPKSVGAVIMKKEYSVSNLIVGGTKEMGQRAGTQSLPAQVGFAKSVQTICENLESTLATVKDIKDYLESELVKIDHVYLNAKSDANVVSAFIDIDIPAKVGIDFFFKNDILLSTKSADTNDLTVKSRTLKAIGLSDYICDRTYRISLSHHKTRQDIDILVKVIKELVKNNKHSELIIIDTNKELAEHLNIRKEVFVKEQKIEKSTEFDEFDALGNEKVQHFSLNVDNEIIGTCRTVMHEDYIQLSRIAIIKSKRNQGYGTLLIQKVMNYFNDLHKDFYIESQFHALKFYENLGFKYYGQAFFKDDVKLIRMIKYFNQFD